MCVRSLILSNSSLASVSMRGSLGKTKKGIKSRGIEPKSLFKKTSDNQIPSNFMSFLNQIALVKMTPLSSFYTFSGAVLRKQPSHQPPTPNPGVGKTRVPFPSFRPARTNDECQMVHLNGLKHRSDRPNHLS